MKSRIRSILQPLLYWLGRRSMQSRLVIAYVVIILVPSMLVSNYLFNQINHNFIEDALKQNQFTVELERTQIEKQVEAMELAAQITFSDKSLMDYLKLDKEPSTSELIEWSQDTIANFSLIQFNTPQIIHWRLFTDNPYTKEMWPTVFKEERIQGESWYEEVKALKGEQLWLFQRKDRDIMKRFAIEPTENQPKLSLYREIHEAGRHIGIIGVEMLLKDFSPRMYTGIRDNDSQMILIDNQGNIFLDQGRGLIGQDPKMSGRLEQLYQDMRKADRNYTQFEIEGRNYLMTTTAINRVGANIVNVVSLEGTLDNISKSKRQIIVANFLLIVLLSIITYFMNSIILKNLRRLTEAMKRMRKGEFHHPVPQIQGSGEVGELAHHFHKLIQTINELIAQGIRKQEITKEAELKTLHNQIDSHFLYNTLENIKMMAEIEGQTEISDALTSLGGMMRYNFKWSGEYVRLRDEIRHIQNYIEVMNIRFDEPVRLSLEIPEVYMELELLKMSLQPIVENALKHGWSGEEQGSRELSIRVVESVTVTGVVSEASLAAQERNICITVTDNGRGIAEASLARINAELSVTGWKDRLPGGFDRSERKEHGIGLTNVQERIRMYYGERYGLTVFSEEGQYTQVVMTIPKVLLTGGERENANRVDRGR